MFRNHEPRLTSALLAAPVLALLMAGGAALPSRSDRSASPVTEPRVQISAAGLDAGFSPVGYRSQAAPDDQTAFTLETGPAAVMDQTFSPVEPTAAVEPTSARASATPMDLISVGAMDLTFTPAAN